MRKEVEMASKVKTILDKLNEARNAARAAISEDDAEIKSLTEEIARLEDSLSKKRKDLDDKKSERAELVSGLGGSDSNEPDNETGSDRRGSKDAEDSDDESEVEPVKNHPSPRNEESPRSTTSSVDKRHNEKKTSDEESDDLDDFDKIDPPAPIVDDEDDDFI
jgi:chromosome segregation ATPase